jgi:hypothetical protein
MFSAIPPTAAGVTSVTNAPAQGHWLQQWHHARQLAGTESLRRDISGAIGADGNGKFGKQLDQVKPQLEIACGHITIAGLKQHDRTVVVAARAGPAGFWAARARPGEQDAVGSEVAMRDAMPVQFQHGIPDLAQLLVSGLGFLLCQRRAALMIAGQDCRFGTDPDQRAQPRGRDAGVLHRVAEQCVALHGPLYRQRAGPRYLAFQQQPPEETVERAGGLLVTVEDREVPLLATADRDQIAPCF